MMYSLYRRWQQVRMFGPLLRLVHLYSKGEDAWQQVEHDAPYRVFGPGSVRPFRWYFEGESAVEVRSVDDICRFLVACEYVRDADLFHEPDFWQHPRTFEQVRRGDCED